MRNFASLVILGCFLWTQPTFAQDSKAYTRVLKLMGCRFELTAISSDERAAQDAINDGVAEIQRIEKMISSWDPKSQTSEIIRNAGIQPVKVDPELFNLIRRSLKVSNLTHGAFDISFASMEKVWRFDGSMTQVPDSAAVRASVEKINYRNIILDQKNETVFLKEKGMRIGFGAIGKGYAANRAREIMKNTGIDGCLVNASGDLITWGKDEGGKEWRIGISDPVHKEKILAWLTINETAVVTSGNYEKFVILDGKRYAHIIDPRTGYPVEGLCSVTIICPDAELADALATSVFVLGKEKGLQLINRLKGIECLLVTDDQQLYTSDNLQLNYYKKSDQQKDKHQINIGMNHE